MKIFVFLLLFPFMCNAQLLKGHFFYTLPISKFAYDITDSKERWAVGTALLANGLKEISDSQFNTGNPNPFDFASGFIAGPVVVFYSRWYFNRKKNAVKFR